MHMEKHGGISQYRGLQVVSHGSEYAVFWESGQRWKCQVMKSHVNHANDIKLQPESSGNPVEDFKQEYD